MIARAWLVALALAFPAVPALAANADHPQENVDKSNDKGGPTGDSKVDDLNKGQLDENQTPTPDRGQEVQPRPQA